MIRRCPSLFRASRTFSCARTLQAELSQTTESRFPAIDERQTLQGNFDQSVNYIYRPSSPSYFTGNAIYNDNLLQLEALTRKYSKLPEFPQNQYPKTYWRTIDQYREIDPTSHVRPTDYRRLLALLNKLNRIDRAFMPQEIIQVMQYYTRERLGADPIKRDLKPDVYGRSFGVGRRKESVSQAWVVPGTGELFINGRSLVEFCARLHDREQVLLPLAVTDRLGKYNVWIYVNGGGTTGQAGAIKLGLAKALVIQEPDLKAELRKAGCLTSDKRRVERKKTGKPKARKSYTWVKR